MLYKNILRTIKSKPLQFLALVLIITMSSFTYVTLQNAVHSLETYLSKYTVQTNQEDFFLIFSPPTQSEILSIVKQKDVALDDVGIVDYYEYKSDELEQTYNVTMEGRFYKDVFEEKDITHTYRFIKQTDIVNQTNIIEGTLPQSDTEIAIFKQYADANNLNISDELKIGTQTFEITGFVTLPDYIYPIFSYDSPLFEPEYETVVIATNHYFESLSEKMWVLYSGYFNSGNFEAETLEKINGEDYIAYALGKDINVRISTLYNDMVGNKLLAQTFSGFILMMAIFIIIMILRKRIESDRVQIGILKAMGYRATTISLNYLLYPLLASICGTLLGYSAGVIVSEQLSNLYVTNYVIPEIDVNFAIEVFVAGVIYPTCLIIFISFISLCYLLYKRPLQLMQKSSHLKMSWLSRSLTKLLAKCSFEVRFKYSLAFRNSGKILGLFLTVLVASVFLVFSSMSFNAVNTVVDRAFKDVNYDYQVKFKSITNEPLMLSESAFLEQSVELVSVTKKDEELMTYETKMPFIVHGIERGNFINPLKNAAGEDITAAVKDGIVINEFISSAYEIEMGDKMTITVHGRLKTFEVVGIVDHYNGPFMYVDLYDLNELLSYDRGIYNGKWTSTRPVDDSDVSYVLSIKDLTRNLDIAMQMVSLTLLVMILIAATLSVIIMLLIANFVIEENYEQISVLKVMGYYDDEISRLVLTIYFPFVMAAYLLSIPITQAGMSFIMALIAKELPFSIPATLNFTQIISGVGIILVTYYISLLLSKRSLRKISLQEALKY